MTHRDPQRKGRKGCPLSYTLWLLTQVPENQKKLHQKSVTRLRGKLDGNKGLRRASPAYPQELLGRSIDMIGQFIQIRRGDEEATAARITYELEESIASAVRENRNTTLQLHNLQLSFPPVPHNSSNTWSTNNERMQKHAFAPLNRP